MIIFGADPISIEQIVAIAESRCETSVDSGEGYRKQIERGASFLDTLLAEEGVIYGVTTGYGDSCTTAIPSALVKDLPHQLLTFHGCGLGDYFNETAGRAIVAARLTSLAKGYSGVSYPLLQRLNQLLELGVIPLCRKKGLWAQVVI